jgi:chromosome segregation ATPase
VAGKPTWRKAFDAVERPVGSKLEQVVQTDEFAALLSFTTQAQAEAKRQLERLTRRALHAVNMPAGSDIKRLHDQIAGLDRRLRDVQDELEAARRGED